MDAFIWLGFVFALSAFAMAGVNRWEIGKLKKEIETLKTERQAMDIPHIKI